MYQHSKIFTILLAFLCLTMTAVAQNPIPNPGFENWTEGFPDGWIPNNVPSIWTTITQSGTSHSGSYALKGEVTTFITDTIPAYLTSIFPVSERHATFSGYYQFTPLGDDVLSIEVIMLSGGMFFPVGTGSLEIKNAAASYSQFNVDIEYFSDDSPDSCYVIMLIDRLSGDAPHPGSSFLIDDLSFTGINDISGPANSNIPIEYALQQNYPNPFNPTTTIEFSLPSSENVSLLIYNATGQVVEHLIEAKQMALGDHKVQWNATALSNGIYFYHLTAGKFSQTRKMVLVK
jgi:hypothetical protein